MDFIVRGESKIWKYGQRGVQNPKKFWTSYVYGPKGNRRVDGDGHEVAVQPQVRRVRERRSSAQTLRRMGSTGKD